MKKVLIIVDTSRLTGRELLIGAEKYISAFTRWEVHTLSPNYLTGDFPKEFQNINFSEFDGFFICYTKNIDRILKIKKPKIIHHTPKEVLPDTSLIVTNSEKIGDYAAEYFISLGFKNYAYCGFKNIIWSEQRRIRYEQNLKKKGFGAIYSFIDSPSRSIEKQRLASWLEKLPKPVCIFACNDDRAIYILEACKSSNINVPEEVAVLGVDNDKIVCNLSSPPLSSIELNFENTGYKAARHLDMLMCKKAINKTIKVDPVEIITRKSTDVFAIEDSEIASALVFIRNNFHRPIQVDDVVKITNISRRELEYRFNDHLKKTIKGEIERLRIDHIKKKLINSNEPFYKIAATLEFTDPEHFSRYFKNLAGISPSKFRQNYCK
jgi:LacI family transcriptional regulator